MHNQIAAPDRNWDGNATDDNSTYWVTDFNRDHYLEMMFGAGESFKDFYLKQSNGRFLAKGDVSDWVTVPYNEARYGAKNNADGYWNYVKDTATAWYNAQKAAGKTDADDQGLPRAVRQGRPLRLRRRRQLQRARRLHRPLPGDPRR